ncbi:hypothetical protein K505DRAFT_346071 [Melanomma pulvis-pyrius CBS 109.77]|uniref:Zn(2)-C6 fungal-type domain-containing protein n=1 Tax=Melanomma pulvis-pyrius CBS 109.77 TaxID=1314802 RepID=A0A6A6XTS9_9PLEO|nr:hypothetical protein K505DRAFT_346071 [Melanomma pulvis-pyrius CBS 109.77]
MQNTGKKRLVSTCIPCYTRKQRCNREYPCNHCARRRRPEGCVYSAQVNQTTSQQETGKEKTHTDKDRRNTSLSLGSASEWTQYTSPLPNSSSTSSLPKLFGYFEDSDSNTLALLRKVSSFRKKDLGFDEDESHHTNSPVLLVDASDEVQRNIERFPDRPILDFLVQYFVAEVNWMDQLVHPPWFLVHYQQWWTKIDRLHRVIDVDFAVLILRICSYASQFLPSPSYTLDKIRGVLLADVCSTCDEIADNLTAICSHLDDRGSLFRVQHLAFLGLRRQNEGRTSAFWEALSRAIQVAQNIGIHSNRSTSNHCFDELEKEMRRRTFCSLYVWDTHLSRKLDRIRFLPNSIGHGNWPQMRLVYCTNGVETEADAPEEFTERLLQARLSDFWGRFSSTQGDEYDMTAAEERYEKFRKEFLMTLPTAFALQPNKEWDNRLAKLPLQRQLLHIAIFDSLCWNFRQLLFHSPNDILNLPAYKLVLLASQKRSLAVAALHVLDGVSALHAMLGGCHTRFVGLVFSTFEAAVLLVSLCLDPSFPGDYHDGPSMATIKTHKADPLRAGMADVTRDTCLQAVQDALSRLSMLAEVSNIAEAGTQTLTRLLGKMTISNFILSRRMQAR